MGPAQYISRASSVSSSTIKQSGGKWFAAFSKFFHFSTAFPGSARGNQGSSQVCTLAVWCTGRRFSSCEFASFLHSEPSLQALELLTVLLLSMHQKYTPRTSNGTTCVTSNNATFTHSAATTANSVNQPSSFSSCCASWSRRQEGLEPKIRSSLLGSAPWDQEPLCSLQHSQVPQLNFLHKKKKNLQKNTKRIKPDKKSQ